MKAIRKNARAPRLPMRGVLLTRGVSLLLSGSMVLPLSPPVIAEPAPAEQSQTATQLTAVKTKLDTLDIAAAPALQASRGQTLYVAPISVSYEKAVRNASLHYRPDDYLLTEADRNQLQKLYVRALRDWFKAQQWTLVEQKDQAALELTLEFTDFWLATPLQEAVHVRATVVADDYARFTVQGTVKRTADSQPLVRFGDSRRVEPRSVRNVTRFNSVVFWKEVEFDTQLFSLTLQDDTADNRR